MPALTIEVPRSDWSRALNEFSAIHEGWLISLEIVSAAIGAQREITDLPLVGLTFEATNGGTVTVSAGRLGSAHITHTIREPHHIWIERTAAGADAALAVESADGAKTILRFRTAAVPETVDGIAHWP
jgi:hypothetical protein